MEKSCYPSISGTAFSISSCKGYPRGEVITDITKTTRVHVHECALVALVQRHGTYLGQVLVLLFKHTGITKPLGDKRKKGTGVSSSLVLIIYNNCWKCCCWLLSKLLGKIKNTCSKKLSTTQGKYGELLKLSHRTSNNGPLFLLPSNILAFALFAAHRWY